jgi:microcompartment protein CcmK/EutM
VSIGLDGEDMQLGRVVGTVVTTHKSEKIVGIKLLLLEKINPAKMEGLNDYVVAADGVGAGIGEVVFYASGSCGRYTEVTLGKPSDATITAIVDYIEIDGKYVYEKDKDTYGAPAWDESASQPQRKA